MKRLSICLLVIKTFMVFEVFGQIESCKNDFCLPLKITPILAGNFGEPRSRHFHAGIDFKTYADGKEVVSVSDGYISRVSVSPWGYGLALYVTHPNGYTSVYGHLSRFRKDIQDFVRRIQYENQSFSLDTILSGELFPVKRSQLIGYSGNTGNSEGPHLHFEIRETESDFSVNTVNTVYSLKDNIKPEVYSVVLYPLSDNGVVDGKNSDKLYKVVANQAGKYVLEGSVIPKVLGNIGVGVSYVDRMNDTQNRFGAESVKLYVNDSLLYHCSMKYVDFEKQKCKNSVFDFSYYLTRSLHVHKAFVEPNNNLNVFTDLVNDGIFYVNPGEEKKIKIEIVDFNENKSIVSFNLKGDLKEHKIINEQKLEWNDFNMILFEMGRVEIDSATLFYNNNIKIKKTGSKKLSPAYKIGDDNVALKTDIVVSLYLDEEALKYKDKVFISRIHNKRKSFLRTDINQNFATARSNSFGEFFLDVDSIAPRIIPKNIKQGVNLSGIKYIEIQIEDDLSGIYKYDLYINDNWVLGEYEPKNKSVRYYFDEYMPKSDKYRFKAVVSDMVGNRNELSCDFYYK